MTTSRPVDGSAGYGPRVAALSEAPGDNKTSHPKHPFRVQKERDRLYEALQRIVALEPHLYSEATQNYAIDIARSALSFSDLPDEEGIER